MAVLERSDLEASPLADLHAIADQMGLEGFRRLRKADLIDSILGEGGAEEDRDEGEEGEREQPRTRRRRAPRLRRGRATPSADRDGAGDGEGEAERDEAEAAPEPEPEAEADAGPPDDDDAGMGDEPDEKQAGRPARGARSRGTRGGSRRGGRSGEGEQPARVATGVVEVLGNGSAFLRVDPPEPSDEDVYISAAQVRRCELVSGDRVSGPVRTPRRSERYPSLVRIDTINDAAADTVSDGVRFDELAVAWPSERLALGSDDKTLEAIEWLTPLGKGSRALIVGPRYAGKSDTLRRILAALAGRDGLEITLVLIGIRPEEVADWQEGPVEPACALTLGASADSQAQAAERALDAARRVSARGGDALVLIDGLDGMAAPAAKKVLSAARKLADAGSLTVIATASKPVAGETTLIALDAALTATGREPTLDLASSGTLRPELLVGEDGAQAIAKARAAAFEG